MRFQILTLGAVVAVATAAATHKLPKPDKDGRYTISAPGISAKFIPYAATLTNLFVKDKNGVERDVVLGYDNTTFYPVDPGHPVYNAIPGRYANRIGNGTFTLDNVTYHLEKNDGDNTLHSGTNNWSYHFWNLTALTANSITFEYHDAAFAEGMPGRVDASVTYTLTENTWHISMTAESPDVRTPIMLTDHTYFNLDAFANPDTDLIWNHTLHLPYSHRNLEADAGALPTGTILEPEENSTDDFYSAPHQLGFASGNADWVDHCGGGCHGYNGQFLFDDDVPEGAVVAELSSEWTGIKAELRTNQAGLVIYTCNWMDGTAPIKSTQGLEGRPAVVNGDGCVAIEAQDWVDGINHPEWDRLDKQIFGPGQEYSWESSWTFGTL
ncbi:hypothetical protein V500_07759 [Pseudogymnoascus sp. VKM F-4518 (FW-2643)]|nr:hypothetical protein V500_07759 [Pseudogymnoascus sp. VKM F-4518 (FW-2643)]